MDRGIGVVLDELFANNDGVFKVIAIEGHETDQHVTSQGKFSQVGGSAVSQHLVFFNPVTRSHNGFLVLAGSFVESGKLLERIQITADLDLGGITISDFSSPFGSNDHARVFGHGGFHAGCYDGRFDHEQGNCLPLHIGTHQCPVGIIVFQERDQSGRDSHHLTGCHIDVLYLFRCDQFKVRAIACNQVRSLDGVTVVDLGIGWCHVRN